jgi:hypothetical protein
VDSFCGRGRYDLSRNKFRKHFGKPGSLFHLQADRSFKNVPTPISETPLRVALGELHAPVGALVFLLFL